MGGEYPAQACDLAIRLRNVGPRAIKEDNEDEGREKKGNNNNSFGLSQFTNGVSLSFLIPLSPQRAQCDPKRKRRRLAKYDGGDRRSHLSQEDGEEAAAERRRRKRRHLGTAGSGRPLAVFQRDVPQGRGGERGPRW